jgi:LPS export ABC transporter protein LptC
MRERGTLALSVVLCSGLAIGSYWVAQQARLSDVVPHQPGHDVDYRADGVTLTRMDRNGRALYTLDATKLVHYYDDDSGELEQPRVVGSKVDRPEFHLRANRGTTTSDAEAVRLYGDVVLTRAPWGKVPGMSAKSEYMLAHPDSERVETDQPVRIVRGGSSVDAGSMQYDNGTQRADFQATSGRRFTEVLEPRAARGPAPAKR